MVYNVIRSNQFKKHYRKYQQSGQKTKIKKIDDTIENLANKKFTKSMNPHPVDETFPGCWDVHVDYDIVILYFYNEKQRELHLFDIGTHSNFGFHESIDDYTNEEMETILMDL